MEVQHIMFFSSGCTGPVSGVETHDLLSLFTPRLLLSLEKGFLFFVFIFSILWLREHKAVVDTFSSFSFLGEKCLQIKYTFVNSNRTLLSKLYLLDLCSS